MLRCQPSDSSMHHHTRPRSSSSLRRHRVCVVFNVVCEPLKRRGPKQKSQLQVSILLDSNNSLKLYTAKKEKLLRYRCCCWYAACELGAKTPEAANPGPATENA